MGGEAGFDEVENRATVHVQREVPEADCTRKTYRTAQAGRGPRDMRLDMGGEQSAGNMR